MFQRVIHTAYFTLPISLCLADIDFLIRIRMVFCKGESCGLEVKKMRQYQIAVIPGDGIGQEVMPEGLKALQAAAEADGGFGLRFTSFPWGCDYYLAHGEMMPKDGLKILSDFNAIYFGAVGFPTVPDEISLRGLRLAICQGFDQYACVRPALLLPGVESPLRGRREAEIDFIVVRENSEGEYSGAGGRLHRGLPLEVAVQETVFTRRGVERIIDFAFQLARSRPRRKLANVTKTNAMGDVFGLWDEVFSETARAYPDVQIERVLVDAMAARFVLKPETLDVVVASNLHADILSDLGGAVSGSLGLAPSANLNPEREYPSMFEPVHGSAPDIFGKGIANPVAMIWSGALMLDFLGEKRAAGLVLNAIKDVMKAGIVRTPDLGGRSRTAAVGDAILDQLKRIQ
jgi:tartrate dehydrogenase/decarboxylase/D-malate dehydrogenase